LAALNSHKLKADTKWEPAPEGYTMNNASIKEVACKRFARKYVGEIDSRGNWHGRGFVIFPNGFVQCGYYVNNERDPHSFEGRTIYPDSSVFTGFYLKGLKEGRGSYHWAHGESYEGGHMHGQPHGKGRYTWADGGSYIGLFVNGLKQGQGNRTWPDGRAYEGPFHGGEMHGKGKYKELASTEFKDTEWIAGKRLTMFS